MVVKKKPDMNWQACHGLGPLRSIKKPGAKGPGFFLLFDTSSQAGKALKLEVDLPFGTNVESFGLGTVQRRDRL